MWDHARLLRRTLQLTSLLTLSGLHELEDERSARWRPGLLLTLTVCLLCNASTNAFIFTTTTAFETMYSMAMAFTSYHSLFLLGYFICRRRRMLGLLRRIAELERATSAWSQPDEHTVFLRLTVLNCAIMVVATAVWMAAVFSQGQFSHPYYLMPVRLPQALLTPSWYPAIMVIQTVFTAMVFTLQIAFELLLVGSADALRIFTARLGVFCQRHVSDNDDAEGEAFNWRGDRDGVDMKGVCHPSQDDHVMNDKLTPGKNTNRNTDIAPSKENLHDDGNGVSKKRIPPTAWVINNSSDLPQPLSDIPGSIRSAEALTASLAIPSDLESRLRILTGLYGSIRRLAEDADDFCSLPTLSLHSTVAAGLLLGGYVCIILFNEESTMLGMAVGFAVFEVSGYRLEWQ